MDAQGRTRTDTVFHGRVVDPPCPARLSGSAQRYEDGVGLLAATMAGMATADRLDP